MLKKIIASIGLCALCVSAPITAHAAVYVEDVNGDVQEYDTVPSLPMPECAHLEYAVGVVTSASGDGVIVYSTDGVDVAYNYIAYRPIPVAVGDVVQSVFVYRADADGDWSDDMVWRIDITADR